MHRSERGDGGRVDAAGAFPPPRAPPTRRRRRRAPRVKREFRRLAAIEPRRRIRRAAERTPVEVHPVRRGEFEDGERRPGVPAASDVSKVPRDEFVRSGGETVRGHHVGAPREPVPARGRHRVAPGRGVDVPSHVRRARAVAVRGTSHDHRDERFAIGRLRGSRRRRVATPRVESRAPVELVHAGGIRGVPEGRPHALVLEETERSVALADGVVRVVLGASRPLGSRAEDGQVVVLEAGDGDGEATERGAAGGVARGDEEEALVAGETQGGGDADVQQQRQQQQQAQQQAQQQVMGIESPTFRLPDTSKSIPPPLPSDDGFTVAELDAAAAAVAGPQKWIEAVEKAMLQAGA